MKSGYEIGGTGGVRGDLCVDFDGDLVDDGCYGKEFGGVVIRSCYSERVGEKESV